MYRKCVVCDGKGVMWTMPKTTTEALKPPANDANVVSIPTGNASSEVEYGLGVECWRCLGKKMVYEV